MPKKYLLYIHSERFADEEKKSGLINDLLDRHYEEQSRKSNFVAAKKGVLIHNGVDPIKRVDLATEVPKTAGEVQEKLSERVDVCEHGASPGFCKHSKCKNARK